MNWRYKALLQLAFSNLPCGEVLNYFCQRYVTRRLPTTDAEFVSRVSIAREHLDAVRRSYGRSLNEANFYEYGAGCDLVVPLAFYALGAECQLLVDNSRLLRLKLVNDAIEKFRRRAPELALRRTPDRYIEGRQYECRAL